MYEFKMPRVSDKSQAKDIIGNFCSSGISFNKWKKVEERVQKATITINA